MSKKSQQHSPYKFCSKCGHHKLKSQFHLDLSSPDKRKNICKSCRGIIKDDYPFFTPELLDLVRCHRHIEVKYFGYFLGILIYIRPREILAFSVIVDTATQGSKILKTVQEAKTWLCRVFLVAADKIKAGLTRKKYGN